MSPPRTPSDMSSSPSIWAVSYVKLQFFARIRRFLQSKSARKRYRTVSDDRCDAPEGGADHGFREEVRGDHDGDGDGDGDLVVLQRSVKRLHFGSLEEKDMAAMEIERLARDDVKVRKLMAELGVVPALVAMVDTVAATRRRAALKALIQLANGTFTNKALMVEAGILSKLPNNIANLDQSTIHHFSELLLSLSSLPNTQFSSTSSQIVPFIISILDSTTVTLATKDSCLGAITNLAAVLDNAASLVSNGAVHALLDLSSTKQLSEKALAALGLLVVTLMGKRAIETSSMVPARLIDVLTWEDKPKCQELSVYILMILAHQSSVQRAKMAQSGIVPVLLEVSLLGSTLAQKRALKLLQWFKDERQTRMGPHSGPQARHNDSGQCSPDKAHVTGKRMMRNLVQQSLNKNMEMITRRANVGSEEDSSSSKLKSLVISTSSKSLPY